ncbi:MAG: hypothetical protein ABEH58_06625 [Haloplanus sp.]
MSSSETGGKIDMLPDGTVLRYKYYRGDYEGVEVRAEVEDDLVKFQGETLTPSGAAREVDELVRGEDAATAHNGWRKWEWNKGDGDWEEIKSLTQ